MECMSRCVCVCALTMRESPSLDNVVQKGDKKMAAL